MLHAKAVPLPYTSRPATWADLPAFVEVANALVVAQTGSPEWTLEDAQTEFSQPGFNISENMRLWEDATGTPVAVGIIVKVGHPPVRPRIKPYILPTLPDFQALGLEVMTWLESTARQHVLPLCPADAKVQMHASTFATYAPTVALYTAYGMHNVRQFWTMRMALHDDLPAPDLPEGMTIRTLRYPEEARIAYRLNEDAFSDHYGHVHDPEMKNYDNWAVHRFEKKSFDPSVWFVVEIEGEIAGFAWCRLGTPDDPTVGWIDSLGVLSAFRRRGIANLLLQHTFRVFRERGMQSAGLRVDAGNTTGATRVYERAGMHIAAKWDTYAKVLRNGVDLTPA